MFEAPNPFRLHPTSISYLYKVFKHLDMLWMGIWVHPFTVVHGMVWGCFWKIEVRSCLNDAVVSWLRLQTVPD
jgi:hypothetical protein